MLSLVLGLVASGLTAGATPAVAETPTASSVERLCGPAQPGLFTCFGMRHTGGGTGKGVKPTAQPPKGYSPADLLDAYALPRNGGAGQTVARETSGTTGRSSATPRCPTSTSWPVSNA